MPGLIQRRLDIMQMGLNRRLLTVPAPAQPNFSKFGALISHWDASAIGDLFQSPTSLTTPVTTNGNPVGAVQDTVSGNTLLAGTNGARGTYAAGAQNGLGVVTFASGKFWQVTLSSLALWDLWFVGRFTGSDGLFVTASGHVSLQPDGGGAFTLSSSGDPIDSAGNDDGNFHVFGISIGADGAHCFLYFDGIQNSQDGSFTPEALTGFTLGNGAGQIGQALLYNGAADHVGLLTALKNKWGL